MKNFIAYDYPSSWNILMPAFKNDCDYRGIFVFVVGANGSGKSTFIANFLKSYELDIKYINADIVEKEYFEGIKDEKERALKSMEKTQKLVKNTMEKGQSFVYESVFSHPSKLELVKKAKELGYKVIAIYVKTNSSQINVERVALRASQGGHDVPKEKILSRYERVKENVEKLKEIVDDFSEFDNSKDLPIVHIDNERNI